MKERRMKEGEGRKGGGRNVGELETSRTRREGEGRKPRKGEGA